MKLQVEKFHHMTKGIKDSGLSQPQADAIVNAVATAVQEVSVTPELLDDRLARQDRKFEGRISELRDDLLGQLTEHKQEMRGQFDEHKQEMREQFTEHKQEMRAQFTEHKNETNLRFDAVDRRFDAVDKRFEAVDKRFETVDKRFDSIDTEIRKLHDSVQGSHRTQLRYFIGFMSAMLAGALGIIGSILST